jgi:hypothetical protein
MRQRQGRGVRGFHDWQQSGTTSIEVPLTIPDMYTWWRADSGITIGTGVSAWLAKFGGRTGSQAVAGKQPAYSAITAAILNNPSLTFDGINDELNVGALGQAARPYTKMFVSKCTNVFNGYLLGSAFTAGNEYFRLSGAANVPPETVGVESTGTTWEAGTPNAGAPWAVWAIIGSGGNVSFYKNGAFLSTAARVAPGGTALDTWIGGIGGAGYLTGSIAEIIDYSRALTAGEILTLYQYANARYGI